MEKKLLLLLTLTTTMSYSAETQSTFPKRPKPSQKELIVRAQNIISHELADRAQNTCTSNFQKNKEALSTVIGKIHVGERHRIGNLLNRFSLLTERPASPFGKKKKNKNKSIKNRPLSVQLPLLFEVSDTECESRAASAPIPTTYN